ncbi:regulator protein cI, partial [Salmonella enterica subsp. enterica]|nr:regulator protein cI [Salmonella enterica subsp. enterica serovar Adelaide]EBB9076331.1 regulator protein cI [Salmonella enterica]EBF8817740.1 regulator protein cI [Salmonella enterica subsp. enterica]EFN8802746.1 regulator protein cI [Escherichia coli]EAQ9311788.1 regulator protein cI [Salmonella enterica subsp. enterica serovar Adelaide]
CYRRHMTRHASFFVSQSTPQSARLWCGVWSVEQMALRAFCPRPLIIPQSQW